MKPILYFLILSFLIAVTLSFPSVIFGQAPNLGTAANFVLFTTTGAVGNTGASQITGDVGTNAGAVTGFGAPAVMNGSIYIADGVTAQCASDLADACIELHNAIPTSTSHAPAFGGGETLLPGVYSIAAAGSIAGVLNLDAQGDPNAVFIFQIGLAFSTGASTTVNLINGGLARNVFWIAGGAIDLGAITTNGGNADSK
jgi:hypothetical protein